MCHMVADSTEELLAMVDRIGVARKWIQYQGTDREHFDVCKSMRAKAVKLGAIEISYLELCRKLRLVGRARRLSGTRHWSSRMGALRRGQS